MADPVARSGSQSRLDATAGREVVFCHVCENEWYNDEYGLQCPRCESEAIEIITPEYDPRPVPEPRRGEEDIHTLHGHNPWEDDYPDPEEEDIGNFAGHGSGPTIYSRTYRTQGSSHNQHNRNAAHENGGVPDIMNDFQRMVSNMLGPNVQHGRSDSNHLYGNQRGTEAFGGTQPHVHTTTFTAGGMRGTTAHFSFTSGPGMQQNGGGQQAGAPPDITRLALPRTQPRRVTYGVYSLPSGTPVFVIRGSTDALTSVLASLLGTMANNNGPHDPRSRNQTAEGVPGMPPMFGNLFANLFNPANAVSGDAVYTQEALDRIISNLMEQNTRGNAPGPAPASAIAALPKKKVDEKMLGAEGKAECSVCMDDVALGDEVVLLPCTHWFHETCASAWLSQHNTCPICRTGLGAGANSQAQTQSRVSTTTDAESSGRTESGSVPTTRGQTQDTRSRSAGSAGNLDRTANGASRRQSHNLQSTQAEREDRQEELRRVANSSSADHAVESPSSRRPFTGMSHYNRPIPGQSSESASQNLWHERHTERLQRLAYAQSSRSTAPSPWDDMRAAPEAQERPRRRYQMVGDPANANGPVQPPQMPGAFEPQRTSSHSGQSHSRRSSASTGSNSQGGGIGGWFRRLGSNNGGSGNGAGGR